MSVSELCRPVLRVPASISPELHVLSSSFFSACYLWPWVGPPGGVAIFYLQVSK